MLACPLLASKSLFIIDFGMAKILAIFICMTQIMIRTNQMSASGLITEKILTILRDG